MQAYRARLREAGLRPVEIWVPDVRAADFAERARQQSLRVSGHESETETLDFIEAIARDLTH